MKTASLFPPLENSEHAELTNTTASIVLKIVIKELGFGFRCDGDDSGEMLVLILVRTVTCCVSLGKSLPLAEPQRFLQ